MSILKKRKFDPDIIASRALEPTFFSAPYPGNNGLVPSPYQHAAVEYRIARRHALIGDAPGLGKTGEALLYGNSIEALYTLIICPASLRLNWEREVRMWSTIDGATTYPVLKSKDGVSLQHNYVIISYDLLRNNSIVEALLDKRWDHMILDEAHALKDPKGNQRTRVICAPDMLPSVVDRITMLSGTILPNQPIECYNAVRLLNWDAIDRMSLEDFREEYYEEGGGWIRAPVEMFDDNGHPYTTHKLTYSATVRNQPVNLEDLQYRLRKHVMVRRLKEDVLKQLPPKRWHPFPIETNSAIKKVLKNPGWKAVEKLYEMDPEAFDRGIPVDGDVATVMRQLGEAKAPVVADYIEELLKSGVHKVLVGCWHVNTVLGEGCGNTGLSVFHYLRQRLDKYGLVAMHGGVSTRAKQLAVDMFQQRDDIRIILGQLVSIGEGWTLTAAQDAVFGEFYWVPGKNDQLLDRLHRRGQQGSYVTGHVPIVPGSMDERVVGTAIWKDQNIYKALDAPI
jgi:SWI/SNF-related matrix-associated actin-dependent regulator 1 of chromatin subfamily A